jgi:hypothetical protein
MPYQPQYPLQAYGGAAGIHPHVYNPNAGFAPVCPTCSLFHFLITDVNSYSLARWLTAAILPASGRAKQNAVSCLMEVLRGMNGHATSVSLLCLLPMPFTN